MRVRLQASVAMTFAALTVLILVVTVGLFYRANQSLALDTARRAMAQAQQAADRAFAAVVMPVGHAVGVTVAMTGAYSAQGEDTRSFAVMDAQLRGVPQVYSLFVATAQQVDFRQVIRLEPGATEFGAARVAVPPGAVRVWRSISGDEPQRSERLVFVAGDGSPLAEVVQESAFDPRTRPWFATATEADGPVVSPVYLFASTGRPGVTLSQAVRGTAGRAVAVVGADMSLDSMAAVLGAVRADGAGEAFLMNDRGELIAASEPVGADGRRPLTEAAIKAWTRDGRGFFRVAAGAAASTHLVEIAPTAPLFGERPVLGLIVPEAHFIGGITATTRRVLRTSAVVALVGLVGVLALARLLSGSLAQVADEARRIGRFDLGGETRFGSQIVEVNDLGTAVANMKKSLASFAAYVPKGVVRSIVASGGTAAVGGAAREVSLMFSDIEGFTRKSESLPPEQVAVELSRYFEAMDHPIRDQGGIIDKYIGDAVMAIWNAPDPVPDHAARACRAALGCRAAERRLRGEGTQTLFPTFTRIGLHSARVVVGNIGSAERLQYTAIGGAVNLASRVEGLNKIYGTEILATGDIVARTGDGFLFRPVDRVSPAGISQPVELFELAAETGPDREHPLPPGLEAEIAQWSAALALYRTGDWGGAARALSAHRPLSSRVRLVDLYLERCAAFIQHPPSGDWDGIAVFVQK